MDGADFQRPQSLSRGRNLTDEDLERLRKYREAYMILNR